MRSTQHVFEVRSTYRQIQTEDSKSLKAAMHVADDALLSPYDTSMIYSEFDFSKHGRLDSIALPSPSSINPSALPY